MSSVLCDQSHFLLHTQLWLLREDLHRILWMVPSVLLFCSLWWCVGVPFVPLLSRWTDWGSTVSLLNMAWPWAHNAEIQWLLNIYILVHKYIWYNTFKLACVGVLCVVVLTLMHEAMNLKLRGSRHNIDILKLKMLSLILTKQRAGVYSATAAWKHTLFQRLRSCKFCFSVHTCMLYYCFMHFLQSLQHDRQPFEDLEGYQRYQPRTAIIMLSCDTPTCKSCISIFICTPLLWQQTVSAAVINPMQGE